MQCALNRREEDKAQSCLLMPKAIDGQQQSSKIALYCSIVQTSYSPPAKEYSKQTVLKCELGRAGDNTAEPTSGRQVTSLPTARSSGRELQLVRYSTLSGLRRAQLYLLGEMQEATACCGFWLLLVALEMSRFGYEYRITSLTKRIRGTSNVNQCNYKQHTVVSAY